MSPISSQNRSTGHRPGRVDSRAARERLVEQARITQRGLALRRAVADQAAERSAA